MGETLHGLTLWGVRAEPRTESGDNDELSQAGSN
jgi:hypothetical protein